MSLDGFNRSQLSGNQAFFSDGASVRLLSNISEEHHRSERVRNISNVEISRKNFIILKFLADYIDVVGNFEITNPSLLNNNKSKFLRSNLLQIPIQ